MQFLILFLVFFVVFMLNRPLTKLVLSVLPVQNIENETTRNAATAAVRGFILTALCAVGFGMIGMGYTVASFFFVWAMLTLIEYVMPTNNPPA